MEDEHSLNKQSKHLLKEMTQKKAQYLLSKGNIQEQEVYTLIKDFFKEFLQVKYEFTVDELLSELKKIYLETHVWKRLQPFLSKMSVIEYSDKKYSEADLREIVREFMAILSIVITAKLPKKIAWHKRLAHILTRRKEEEIEELEDMRINAAQENEIYNEVEHEFAKEQARAVEVEASGNQDMDELIKQINEHLDKSNKKEAGKLYKKLSRKYSSLDTPAKQLYYETLNKIYEKVS